MVSIIGGGPSGSYLAYLLAKEGGKVHVFEEHSCIGRPVQCTGLLTNFVKNLIDISDDFLVNTIRKIKVVAPNGDFADFKLKNPDYVFDRRKFDEHMANIAMKEGAVFSFGKRFVGFSDGKINFEDGSTFETDLIVGADGPLSKVAKHFGMFNDRKFMNALQARAKGKFYADTFVVYLGEKYFGWSVPENPSFSRIGVICSDGMAKKHFDSVLEKENGSIIEYQSGIIPVYQPKIKCQKGNVFLLGDAATQCKASTHGGLIQGMLAANALKDAILSGESYDKLWRKKLGKDLYMHLKLRERIDKLSDNRLNYLIKLVNKEKVKNILETYERDFASKIIFKLLAREPRFLKFVFAN